jgi:protein SERAC1
MTFGYNAGVKSELTENFIRIKGIAASLTGGLANKRRTREVQKPKP